MSNNSNIGHPCIEKPGLHFEEGPFIWGDGNTYGLGANLEFQEGGNLRTTVRNVNNPILIRMPGTEDVQGCTGGQNLWGTLYQYGWSGRTNAHAGAGGSGLSFNGDAVINVAMDFPYPIDFAISLRSFNHRFGFSEFFFFRTPCDEFIAGPGSTLATNPNGYPANTRYADGNSGGSIAIYRGITQWRASIKADFRVSSSIGFTVLKSQNIIRGDVNDGSASWPPPIAIQEEIVNQRWDSSNRVTL